MNLQRTRERTIFRLFFAAFFLSTIAQLLHGQSVIQHPNGDVVVTGTAANDHFFIEVDLSDFSVVRYHGNLNGEVFEFDAIANLSVDLGGGANQIYANGLHILRDLTIVLGNGNDLVNLKEYAKPGYSTRDFRIEGHAVIGLGDGNNRLNLDGMITIGGTSIAGGAEIDRLTIIESRFFGPVGISTFESADVIDFQLDGTDRNQMTGGANIDTGSGDDQLLANRLLTHGLVSITTGSGSDFIYFENYSRFFYGDFQINTGSQDDTVIMEDIICNTTLTIDTGNHNDEVRIDGELNFDTDILTRRGDDRVVLAELTVDGSVLNIETGRDDDSVFLEDMEAEAYVGVQLGGQNDFLSIGFCHFLKPKLSAQFYGNQGNADEILMDTNTFSGSYLKAGFEIE